MDYFTADFHFADPRLPLFPRPFATPDECREHIIREHAAILRPEDTLYVIGDVALGEGELAHLRRIPGRKVLLRGNYDRLADVQYLTYFDSVHEHLDLELEHDGRKLSVRLNHYPTRGVAERFNLVGHVHGAWRVQKNMLNVGVDAHFFRPLSAERVLFFHNAICRAYDQDVWCGDHPANAAHAGRGGRGAAAAGSFRPPA